MSRTIDELLAEIKSAAEEVWGYLGPGFLEKVYQESLMYELELRGIKAREEVAITTYYKGKQVGAYRTDIMVEDKVIVELKSCAAVTRAHSTQLVNYLNVTRIDYGVLINFGAHSLFLINKTRNYHKNS